MNKYQLLIAFNMPFVIFGILHVLLRYKERSVNLLTLFTRLVFWITIGIGIIFAEQIYNFLIGNNLTNSPPLSVPDVILATGVSLCFFLLVRIYTKLDNNERKLMALHERISILLSEKNERA